MARVSFKTYGCSNNFHESEAMAGLLRERGDVLVDSDDEADAIVLNLCTVKGDKNALKHVRKTKERFPDKGIIAGGCITKSLQKSLREEGVSLLNTHAIGKIDEVMDRTLRGERAEILEWKRDVKVGLPKARPNPMVNIVPISNGCTSACSFCSVKMIKGHVVSYPVRDIVQEISDSVKEGVWEIWLTSQDTADYGLDWLDDDVRLPHLLNEICSIPKDFRVRLGMGNPKTLITYLPELVEAMKDDRMFKFVHIPIQSGNNRVLDEMKRENTVEQYLEIVETLKREIPDITISTDIIVGFPGESEEEFMDTVRLVERTEPEIVNLARFQARPGTMAARMEDQIHGKVSAERSRRLTKVFWPIAKKRRERWIGRECDIVIVEKGNKEGTVKGHNDSWLEVIVEGDYELGARLKVEIVDATKFYLKGRVLIEQ